MSDANFSRIKDCTSLLPKSKILAGGGTPYGKYPFYLSGQEVGRIDEAMSSEDAVVMGTGGVATVVFAQGEYAYSSGNFAFKSNKKSLRTDYLFRALEAFLPVIDYKGFQGSGLKHLDKPFLFNLFVAIPPLAEQRKIVAALISVDEVIVRVQTQINKLQDLKQATIGKLFANGEQVSLHELIETPINGTRPRGGVSLEGDVPSFGGENVTMTGGLNFYPVKKVSFDFFNQMRRGHLYDLDVVINKDGANTGKSAIYRDSPYKQACINEHLFILRGKKEQLDQVYLHYLLQSSSVKKTLETRIAGSAQPGLGSTFCKNFPVEVASLSEQRKIAAILSSMDNAIEEKQRKLCQTAHLKKALMQDLLTGKIRV